MQLKHPELLYALIVLAIPVIVHLFQLRRFKKTPFTNVKILKEVVSQTRKSRQLKKWLVLFSRVFALACIILAFAQPYKPSASQNALPPSLVVYIDNNLSMQAQGAQGSLLETVSQQLYGLSSLPEQFAWFTNNRTVANSSAQEFKDEILSLDYSANSLDRKDVLLKAHQLFDNHSEREKKLVWISNFQGIEKLPELEDTIEVHTIALTPSQLNNISIDSVYATHLSSNKLEITAVLTNHGDSKNQVAVALFNEETLTARSATPLESNSSATINFEVENSSFDGHLQIDEAGLEFDNRLYFSVPTEKHSKVLHIYEAYSDFLSRIFTDDEFILKEVALNQLDFSIINHQNTIILNELRAISPALQTALAAYANQGGTLVIIPNIEANIESYNQLFKSLRLHSFQRKINQETNLSKINFSHPIYKNVFETETTNFQFPKVNQFFELNGKHTPLLTLDNRHDFLMQKETIYLFSAPLNSENSNFTQSPLVVPTFYRTGKSSLPLPKLYFTIGERNSFSIPTLLSQDRVLNIKNNHTNLIPLQQNPLNQVLITTEDLPNQAGKYGVFYENELLKNISYNYSRAYSSMQFTDPKQWENAKHHTSIETFFNSLSKQNNETHYWKWFLIFALIFFIIEMLLLKFLK